MWKYSLRTLLLIMLMLAASFAAARVGLRISQPRWTVVYAMPRNAAGSPAQSNFDASLASFDDVIVPWMRNRGYLCRNKPGPRNDGFMFEKSPAGSFPRGVHIAFVPPYPHFRDNYVEVEIFDYVPRWRWETAPPITPSDDELKLTAELQSLLESHFAFRAGSLTENPAELEPTDDTAEKAR